MSAPLPPVLDLAVSAGLPALVDLLAARLPSAFAPLADAYRDQALAAADSWIRALLGDLLAQGTLRVDAARLVIVDEREDDDPTI